MAEITKAFQALHYGALSDDPDTDVDMDDGLNLPQCQDIGVFDCIELVQLISALALKQHILETDALE